MKTVLIKFLFIFLFGNIIFASPLKEPPIHQLRIYEIPKENVKVFHERFRDHAHRIMKKYGFKIVSTWESSYESKVEFIYLLEWKDEKAMKKSWANFMEDQEWKDIKKQTGALYGAFVENIEDRTLILTDYSPQKHLLEK
ncbi:NIPSNAP family protein [Abyssalbus ytuae]|uniref:NIPSNAP family protein n=1 Tax=Abyssalbus ytuae TaxID=2926907 RepID=A0A9E6ZR87_9FLAO|nr:NIPSNAP family protein [Abyssalbus ytuae]UOB19444.1 NIPSNAP family protein [Abyssalbus ytuae]